MSKATLIASRSAQTALISCLALRRPRAMLVVSVMIYMVVSFGVEYKSQLQRT